MAVEAKLGKKLTQVGEDAQYDACAKRLLSEKIVLAFILKYAVPEFQDCSLEDIRDKYIEGVYIGRIGVDADDTNPDFAGYIQAREDGSEITGQNVESVTDTEGKIVYDIIFDVTLPATKEAVRLIINVEAQKSDDKKYEMVTRGVVYCARMISAQKDRVFQKSDYQLLRKVYSIWVVMNPREGRKNTATAFEVTPRDLAGKADYHKDSYDKMSVVMLNLGGKDETEETLLRFLEVLLSPDRDPDEKKQVLLNDFGVDCTSEMEEEMNDMCNLSMGIREESMRKGIEIGEARGEARGLARGEARGEARGLARGEEKKAREIAVNLHSLGIDTDKIAQAVGFGIDTVKQWIAAAQKA